MTAAPPDRARIDGLFELAFRRHQAGQLEEAGQLYRSILEIDPRQLDALHLLGMIALQSGRAEQAVELIGQAIAANDRIPPYHGAIAEAYRALGQRDQAIEHYRKALSLDPTYAAAKGALNDLLRQGGGNTGDALDRSWRAVLANDTETTRAQFVEQVRTARSLPGDSGFRHVLIRAFTEIWARPVELAGAAIALVKSDPAIATAIRAGNEVWPRRIPPRMMAPALAVLTNDPLIYCVLESTPVADTEMEQLLASVRTLLIDAALTSKDDIAPEMVPFSCALARQCFINEYVFHVPDVEQDGIMALRAKLRAELSGLKPVFAIQLIAYACYAPLHTLDRNDFIVDREWLPAVNNLIVQQVREPDEEAKYRAKTPKLTAITDQTSAQVREQYEDNPYPRWTLAAPAKPANGIGAYLKDEFPLAPLQQTAEPASLDILIAGCGTGQQAIDAARRFPNARVLAIDLSLTSLGHAQRKAAELAVTNIEFGQADILAFETDRAFDVIEVSGVLHHLADPMLGWSRLLRLLKPGGFMRLGLYSDLARAGVVAARQFIAAGGYDGSADSIRRCRQNLLKARDPRLSSIFASPDFFSTSGCRDLLFHVQEQRMTLPDIAAFMAEHRLSFLGFELGEAALALYRARFPADGTMTDLATWHLFETDNPATFASMYQFWVQKAA